MILENIKRLKECGHNQCYLPPKQYDKAIQELKDESTKLGIPVGWVKTDLKDRGIEHFLWANVVVFQGVPA